MKSQPAFLYGLDLEDAAALIQELGFPAYRARQLLEWMYHHHIDDLARAKNLPKDMREALEKRGGLKALTMEEPKESSEKQSVKYLFKTEDGRYLESVLISQSGRRTVCVSTQLGCKIGCTFCASGKGKFGRDLSAGEIIEQVVWISRHLNERVTNVVFMGMGEPLDNFEATMKALKILQEDWGFGMGPRRITVSTSGITPKMVEFVNRSEGRVRLSVSLHSSNEATRTRLVPINKRYGLHELVAALTAIHKKLKRDITFEYTLIDGVNDSVEEARGVAKIAAPLNAKVNIIPYNPIREMDFKTPAAEKVGAFRALLEKKGIRVTVRQTAGRDIDAACGQLRLDREHPVRETTQNPTRNNAKN